MVRHRGGDESGGVGEESEVHPQPRNAAAAYPDGFTTCTRSFPGFCPRKYCEGCPAFGRFWGLGVVSPKGRPQYDERPGLDVQAVRRAAHCKAISVLDGDVRELRRVRD